ncbi:MAG: pyrroloquinoline quinone biosynthesis protein PqqB [Gemmatimonadetes bacterium]|nr:pyrroloquinoline quinone biosynthesis protein PqqB [Gemmatimonadota bacterium]
MKIRVLGAAAGGGLPQWNCHCRNCSDARRGAAGVLPRTQSSIAVSSDGRRWVLFNASPDLRSQTESLTRSVSRSGTDPGSAGTGVPPATPRASVFDAVFLTDAEIDHTAGLLLLREGGWLVLYATAFVHGALRQNGLLRTLAAYLQIDWREVPLDGAALELRDRAGDRLGLEVTAFAVAGDPPLYHQGNGTSPAGHTIGVRVTGANEAAGLVYVPGTGDVDDALLSSVGAGDMLLLDGTFWADDELAGMGISQRRALDMGHLPIGGPNGSLTRLRDISASRRAYIHLNNTNPVLREGSPERRAVEAAGWEVAYDGMELDV